MDRIGTERLILRPFTQADAADVYAYAKDPRVGPHAGWPAHRSVEESLEIIRTVFAQPGVFAMELRETGNVIGSVGFVGLHPAGVQSGCPDDEIGYALSPAFWGRGLMPEAVEAVLRLGFTDLDLWRIWCGHYAGNWRSCRVIQKCGFRYQFSTVDDVALVGETRLTYHYVQTREEWHDRVSGTL